MNVDINLIELEIDAARITAIEANVFASQLYAKVKKLNFKKFQIVDSVWDDDIRKYIFVGFEALEELMITDSLVKIYDSGWLDNINGTIKSLVLTGTGEEKPLMIEKLTGGTARFLSNVEYVKIEYNLMNFIDYRSFTAIPNVRELDLSNCSITVIGNFSFETLGAKLQLLNLERNRLKTLPDNIFGNFYLSSGPTLQPNEQLVETNLIIRLGDNLWHCDCSMDHLKDLLIANTNFDGDILCTTPEVIVNYPIRETEFCPLPMTTVTTTESSTVPIDDDDGNGDEKECSSYNDFQSKVKISIQPQMQRIRLNGTATGVAVMLDNPSKDLILIWFEAEKFTNASLVYYQQSNASNCFINLFNPIFINDLEEHTSYTFCLMNISQQTVSPFDCISHYNGKVETSMAVWLYDSYKPLTVSLIVIACIANIVVGVIIGATFLKFWKYETFSFRLALQCKTGPPHEAINSQFK